MDILNRGDRIRCYILLQIRFKCNDIALIKTIMNEAQCSSNIYFFFLFIK